jgi:mRNA-degrading endonuclease toxin of MazEF toxin-antitoxin module
MEFETHPDFAQARADGAAFDVNNKLRTIGVVPLSSSPRPLPPLIVSTPPGGQPTSTALCGQLRTIDKRRIVDGPMGRLSQDDLEEVDKNVKHYYGL